MFHNTINFCRTLLLAGAVGVLSAGATQAAPPRASHAGGFHNAFRPSFHNAFRPSFHNAFRPSFHSGFRGNFRHVPHFRGFRSFGFFPYPVGYGFPAYPSSSYSPSYSYPSYSYGSGFSSSDDSDGYENSDLLSLSPYDEGGSALSRPAPDNTASVTVKVNPKAELWVDHEKMTASGAVRTFVTPELTPGRSYVYEVQARWRENGREVTRTRKIDVSAGASVEVDFTKPAPASTPRKR